MTTIQGREFLTDEEIREIEKVDADCEYEGEYGWFSLTDEERIELEFAEAWADFVPPAREDFLPPPPIAAHWQEAELPF